MAELLIASGIILLIVCLIALGLDLDGSRGWPEDEEDDDR